MSIDYFDDEDNHQLYVILYILFGPKNSMPYDQVLKKSVSKLIEQDYYFILLANQIKECMIIENTLDLLELQEVLRQTINYVYRIKKFKICRKHSFCIKNFSSCLFGDDPVVTSLSSIKNSSINLSKKELKNIYFRRVSDRCYIPVLCFD